ncbi:hypothetical protein [Agromyces sp. LHK192]|uniref:hypothetical protein n=1 Tax=Agromyces sp. LHK192 TaxID=2498704 RepID=UPI000FDB0B21|nr:hypothetical protein [Agromyces sp. LHK192]
MHFAGVLPEDAPDPRVEATARLRSVPFAVVGLAPQAALEDTGFPGFEESISWRNGDPSGSRATTRLTVSLTYQLWRNPDDRDDPVNLAGSVINDDDEPTRDALDDVPPWPRPAWLVEQAERMRHPHLWEVVRTSWHRDRSEDASVPWLLAHHVNHILMNRFRDEVGYVHGTPLWEDHSGWQVADRAARGGVTARLDGVDVPAVEIDTDPFVYGIGFDLAPGVFVTAAIPRDELRYLDVSFATVFPGTAPGA